MNNFVDLYKKLRRDNPETKKLFFFRAIIRLIAENGTIDDLKEFEKYYSTEEENMWEALINETNKTA